MSTKDKDNTQAQHDAKLPVMRCLTSLLKKKEGNLFIHLWLLDYQGEFFYDNYDPEHLGDLHEVKEFLISQNIPFKEGKNNRSFLSVNIA